MSWFHSCIGNGRGKIVLIGAIFATEFAMTQRSTGSLVTWEVGTTTAYALKSTEERGTLFHGPGVEVYDGIVIGEKARAGGIPIKVCRKKHLTNVRSSHGDMEIRLTPPRHMSIDKAIEYLADNELLEVTPLSYRIRKRILNTDESGKQPKREFIEALME